MADTYTLALVQGQTFTRRFVYKINGVAQTLADYEIKAQIRKAEKSTATLILELEDYLTEEDATTLKLRIPGTVLAGLVAGSLFTDAHWDMFAIAVADPTDSRLLVQGTVSLDPATTDILA